jgi:glycine dehydrogenase subunit 1
MRGNQAVSILGDDPETGIDASMDKLIAQIDAETGLVMVQYPDFFGRVIDYKPLIEAAHNAGRWWPWLSTQPRWASLPSR